MTVEEHVYGVLQHLGSCFIEHLPVNAALPTVVYQRVGGIWETTNCGSELLPEIRLCVFANSPSERSDWVARIQEIANQHQWIPEDVLVFEYDYETKAYCAIWSYLIDF